MSGPKLVRVVTREELAIRCQAAMAGLRAAARQYQTQLKRQGEVPSTELDERVKAIEDDLAALKVNGLEARIQSLTTFVAAESVRLAANAQQKVEQKRQAGRRSIDTARALARALGERNALAQRLSDAIESAKGLEEGALQALSKIMESAYAKLREQLQAGSTSRADKDMANRLLAGQGPTLVQWAATNVAESPADARVERLLAQIQVMGDDVDVFARRAYDVSQLEDSSQKAARTDSLVLELAEAGARSKRLAELKAKAASVKDGLAVLQTGGEVLSQALSHAMETRDEGGLTALVAQAEKAIERRVTEVSASARRRAVLDGLKGLGYSVQETLETAWVEKGRIVLSRPDDRDYGVELGASPDAQNMQIRLVGAATPTKPRTAQRDTSVEQQWCSEFEQLRQAVARTGTEIVIKRAVGVGVEPVRTIENADLQRLSIVDATKASPRTLNK